MKGDTSFGLKNVGFFDYSNLKKKSTENILELLKIKTFKSSKIYQVFNKIRYLNAFWKIELNSNIEFLFIMNFMFYLK